MSGTSDGTPWKFDLEGGRVSQQKSTYAFGTTDQHRFTLSLFSFLAIIALGSDKVEGRRGLCFLYTSCFSFFFFTDLSAAEMSCRQRVSKVEKR